MGSKRKSQRRKVVPKVVPKGTPKVVPKGTPKVVPLYKIRYNNFYNAFSNQDVEMMNYETLCGFLFVIASAPETVHPFEFIPVIFNAEDMEECAESLGSEKEAKEFFGAVTDCFNDILSGVRKNEPQLPLGYDDKDDPVQIFETDDHPLSFWASGFVTGCLFIEDCWDSEILEELDFRAELGSTSMVLSVFSEKSLAEAFMKEVEKTNFKKFAQLMHSLIPDAIKSYAYIGWSIHEATLKVQGKKESN
ncbi:MAG: UPF0149 family protein [Leptospirales bacterium]